MIRKLSPLPFTLYYVKDKDLILADFLSHIPSDNSDSNEVLPISFVDLSLQENFSEQLNVVTRFHTKQDGVNLPEIHGADKAMDPHKKPEHQLQIAKPLTAPHIVPGVVQFTPAPAPKPRGLHKRLNHKLCLPYLTHINQPHPCKLHIIHCSR